MKKPGFVILLPNLITLLLIVTSLSSQAREDQPQGEGHILSGDNLNFLEQLVKDVVDSSRILPGQTITGKFGPNNTGGNLIRPGGRDCYPSFWIRDYAMSVECGFITAEEQKHMLLLTASTQCDRSWITAGGSMVPYGAIADHIRIDDMLPVYFPGTYDYKEQGNKIFGMYPPYDDQFFFIHMAYLYVKRTSDTAILNRIINGIPLMDRLETAFNVPPSGPDNDLSHTNDDYRGVDFGFRDIITITGDLCMTSILKYRAAEEMAGLYGITGNSEMSERYRSLSVKLKKAIPEVFLDERGMLLASTGKSRQPDVWSTGLAIYLNILEGEDLKKSCRFLAESYRKGYLSFNGNIRHILTTDDYSGKTAWEFSLAEKNTYQNGAYWGTATGWICYAIAKADLSLARKLANEYVEDLRSDDFRKGMAHGAPYECCHPSGHRQNPVYMTTVTCPFIVFSSMNN